jgi:hypothetical protein
MLGKPCACPQDCKTVFKMPIGCPIQCANPNDPENPGKQVAFEWEGFKIVRSTCRRVCWE